MEEEDIKKVDNIIGGYENQLNAEKNKSNDLAKALSSTSMYSGQDPNLIVFQLELDNILEKIEHLLRGDVIKADEKTGDLGYYTPDDDKLVLLNDYGVQLIMNIISSYLNRNTILSCYDLERIYEIMNVLGEEIADVIFCNYEHMGMISQSKKSRYPLLVISILNIVESTYRRSLDGRELDSLRTGRIVTQTDSLGRGGVSVNAMPGQIPKKSFSLMDPKTW